MRGGKSTRSGITIGFAGPNSSGRAGPSFEMKGRFPFAAAKPGQVGCTLRALMARVRRVTGEYAMSEDEFTEWWAEYHPQGETFSDSLRSELATCQRATGLMRTWWS